ncbi:MAG: type II toxin-antitoxin system RelE/ParE family toxin [Desulfotomaculaceae bacterium]|nr:type II toxin-antitoxin system RelE/ParE family toxin [Desulfotomaculaceae bacterium]
MSGEKQKYNIIFSPTAKKQFLNLDRSLQARIKIGIQKLAQIPSEGDILKLKGRNRQYRLRLGNWRVIFMTKDDIIQIIAILPRGQAYK